MEEGGGGCGGGREEHEKVRGRDMHHDFTPDYKNYQKGKNPVWR